MSRGTHNPLGIGLLPSWPGYDDPCDEFDHERVRPPEPVGEDLVWYRGWECGWDRTAEFYTGAGYSAYKGGVDLDAPRVDGHGTWRALLDAVDDEEDD